MSTSHFLRLYGVGLATFLVLDLLWLGVLAKNFYQQHLGYLMRADVRWVPAACFYLLFVAALVVFVAAPGIERGSLGRTMAMGAFFGLAAYAAFDLTSLALIRDFPLTAALVDLAWGAVLSAVVAGVVHLTA